MKTKDIFANFSGETKLEERTIMLVDRIGKKPNQTKQQTKNNSGTMNRKNETR